MEAQEIQQMFRDYATIKNNTSLNEDELLIVVRRFEQLNEKYMAEYIRPKSETQDTEVDWKSAMQYLAMLFQRMDVTNPEASDTNRQVWNIIKPAVIQYYDK